MRRLTAWLTVSLLLVVLLVVLLVGRFRLGLRTDSQATHAIAESVFRGLSAKMGLLQGPVANRRRVDVRDMLRAVASRFQRHQWDNRMSMRGLASAHRPRSRHRLGATAFLP